MKKIIDCKKTSEYIVFHEEGHISAGQWLLMKFHLLYCSMCRAFARQNKQINHWLGQKKSSKELSNSQKMNLQTAIEQKLKEKK